MPCEIQICGEIMKHYAFLFYLRATLPAGFPVELVKLILLFYDRAERALISGDGCTVCIAQENKITLWNAARIEKFTFPSHVRLLCAGARIFAACTHTSYDNSMIYVHYDGKITSHTTAHRVLSVSCGSDHLVVLQADGHAYGFGGNSRGQLGIVGRRRCSTLLMMPLEDVRAVSCRAKHTLLLTDGGIFACGRGVSGSYPYVAAFDPPSLIYRVELEDIPTRRENWEAICDLFGHNITCEVPSALSEEHGEVYAAGVCVGGLVFATRAGVFVAAGERVFSFKQ